MQQASHDSAAQSALIYKKIAWHLMPFLILIFILSYLDRVNIGYAKLQFSADLGFSDAVYGLGAGIFFIGYFFFEVPSNLLLKKIGARLTLARIMILWGLLSASMMFVKTIDGFYLMRFLLGIAEAGLVPGVVLYLTYWFPSSRRARMTALFLMAIPISGFLGAPLSGYIMHMTNGIHSLRGWQWMFLIEGLPSVAVGIWALFYLSEGPKNAHWLSPAEKTFVLNQLALEEEEERRHGSHQHFWQALLSQRFWLLTAVYFCSVLGVTGLVFWLPQIIKDLGVSNLIRNGEITALPYVAAAISMLLVSRSSDRTGERRWHYALSCLVGASGLIFSSIAAESIPLAVFGLALASAGIYSSLSVFWSIATSHLQGTAAVAGIALINSVANLAGYAGPYAMGLIRDKTHSSMGGLYLIAAFLACSAWLSLSLPKSRRNIDPAMETPSPAAQTAS